jgi:hypothetical protein
MTKPWKAGATAMAVFGFVYGYAGTAGAPFCGSLGQCLQHVVDAGPPWFYPASLIPGAIGTAVFAALAYLLFLLVYGVRAAVRGTAGARTSQESPAPVIQGPPAAKRLVEVSAIQGGPRRWSRPTPLLLAVGAALVWAVMSVGPSRLVGDLDLLSPRDATTAPVPFCSQGYRLTPTGACASTAFPMATFCEQLGTCTPAPITAAPRPELACGAVLDGSILPTFTQQLEADGMCHERSGGTAEPLVDDLFVGGRSGLLAFLAVGAALLLWPRLRAAGQPQA